MSTKIGGDSEHNAFSKYTDLGAALTIILLISAWWMRVLILHPGMGEIWWDWRIYKAGLDAMFLGGDPYDIAKIQALSGTTMSFAMPPLVTRLLRAINDLANPTVIGNAIWLASTVGYFLIPFLTIKILYSKMNFGLFVLNSATTIAAFKGGGLQALLGANMSIAFHASILVGLFFALKDKKWNLFYAFVLIACLFKPYFAAYLIFPALLFGWSWKEFWTGSAVLTVSGALYLIGASMYPEEQSAFLRNLTVINFEGLKQYGVAALNAGIMTFGDARSGYVSAFIFAAAVLPFCLFGLPRQFELRIAALLCIVTIINPRMNHYDVFVAAVPAAFIISRFLHIVLDARWPHLPLASLLLVLGTFLYRAENIVLTWVFCGLLFVLLFMSLFVSNREAGLVGYNTGPRFC